VNDLLVPHRNGGQSRLYLGARGARLTTLRAVAFGPPDAAIRVAQAADFDGDGRLDVVVIDARRGIAIYPGRGDGTFDSPWSVGSSTVVPYELTVADLDCDGRADFVVGNVQAPSWAFVNRGDGGFARVDFGDGAGTVYGLAVGDINRDGRPDIVAARSEAPNGLYLTTEGEGRCR